MSTLAEVIAAVGPDLPGAWYSGVVSGGSTGYLLDNYLGGSDRTWRGGTVIVTYAGGTAPEFESRIISVYDAKDPDNKSRIVPDAPFTAAPTAGDRFGVIKGRFPRNLIVEKVNAALGTIWLWYEDETLETESGVLEYVLPDGINASTLLQVWLGYDGSFEQAFLYEVVEDTGDHRLRFHRAHFPGYTIRLVYRARPERVFADADEIDGRIPLEALAATVLRRVVEFRYSKFSVAPDRETNALNAALKRERVALRSMPTPPAKPLILPRKVRF